MNDSEESYMMQQEYHQQDQLILQQLEESKMDKKYVNKPGTMSFFKVDKEGNDKRPDWSGPVVDPNGKEWQGALWISESQKGTIYLSGKMSEPYNPNSDAPSQGSAMDAPF
jgi:hypothetical protein